MSNLRVGTIVTGTVIVVEDNLAYISVGGKSEGRMYLEYFTSSKDIKSLKDVLKVGQVLKVQVAKMSDGLILLSRLEMEEREKREKTIRKIINHRVFNVHVESKTKDGDYLVSKDGVMLLLPQNYVDLNENFDKDSIIGTDSKVMLIKTETDEKGKQKFIVSRKQIQYNEERHGREKEFEAINQGDELDGVVTRITDFGCFVKFNYCEGLCHNSEISNYRVKDAHEFVKEGDSVKVKVIKKTESKLHLSMKALQKTPFEVYAETHHVGDTVDVTIIKVEPGYCLLEAEKEVVGIMNKADYSWNRDDKFGQTLQVGSKLSLKIVSLDASKGKMSLSRKHLEYNPWAEIKLDNHQLIEATVISFDSNGAVLKYKDVNATISNKEASETGKTAQDVFKVGDIVKAEVVNFDPSRWILELSVRTIEEKKTREYVDKYLDENVSSDTSLGDLFKDEK